MRALNACYTCIETRFLLSSPVSILRSSASRALQPPLTIAAWIKTILAGFSLLPNNNFSLFELSTHRFFFVWSARTIRVVRFRRMLYIAVQSTHSACQLPRLHVISTWRECAWACKSSCEYVFVCFSPISARFIVCMVLGCALHGYYEQIDWAEECPTKRCRSLGVHKHRSHRTNDQSQWSTSG